MNSPSMRRVKIPASAMLACRSAGVMAAPEDGPEWEEGEFTYALGCFASGCASRVI